MERFSGQEPTGTRAQELEVLVRTAIFKPATASARRSRNQTGSRLWVGWGGSGLAKSSEPR